MPKGMVAMLSEKQISTCNLRWGEIIAVGVATGNPGMIVTVWKCKFYLQKRKFFC